MGISRKFYKRVSPLLFTIKQLLLQRRGSPISLKSVLILNTHDEEALLLKKPFSSTTLSNFLRQLCYETLL